MNHKLISLACEHRWRYATVVRRILQVLCLFIAFYTVSCGKKEEVVEITEKREFLEDYDQNGFEAEVPLTWRRTGDSIPGAAFRSRVLNYQFGAAGGEMYVSIGIKGGILPNLNRWLEEIGNPKVKNTDSFELIKVSDTEGFLVEAYGAFKGQYQGWGVLGVIVESPTLGTLSIKLVGPEKEVKENKSHFLKACETLKHYSKDEK